MIKIIRNPKFSLPLSLILIALGWYLTGVDHSDDIYDFMSGFILGLGISILMYAMSLIFFVKKKPE